ncbi:unnamed protein product [Ectocarpus sp. 6 AP-2014]
MVARRVWLHACLFSPLHLLFFSDDVVHMTLMILLVSISFGLLTDKLPCQIHILLEDNNSIAQACVIIIYLTSSQPAEDRLHQQHDKKWRTVGATIHTPTQKYSRTRMLLITIMALSRWQPFLGGPRDTVTKLYGVSDTRHLRILPR